MSELIDYKNGQFHIENCDVESLIERFSSPLYVYSKGQILKTGVSFSNTGPHLISCVMQ